MYSTCLHCHHSLGRNDAIEAFSVGRRLAFDAAKGRLWVVCHRCARWNLTPIEERWEAVEECERAFRAQRLRMQTANVGLVRLAEGTELIRIGSPLRPEFAAWRYGRVMKARLERRLLITAGAAAVGGAGLTIGVSGSALMAAAVAAGPFIVLPASWVILIAGALRGRVLSTTVLDDRGRPLSVVAENLQRSSFTVDNEGTLSFDLQHIGGRAALNGERALRALTVLLARVNRGGGGARVVRRATDLIGDAGDAKHLIARVAEHTHAQTKSFEARSRVVARGYRGPRNQAYRPVWVGQGQMPRNRGALTALDAPVRLALEMALHESAEQHALDAELAELERAWQEAEEIAGIADGILTPLSSPFTHADRSKSSRPD